MTDRTASWQSRNPTLRWSHAGQRFALDRGSVRTVDQDGHMHVALNPISKANISGYYGSEIPDAEALGLQPDVIYQLYRDPDELRKAAQTFNGKPLLLVHKPQSAADHSRELTVGSVKNPQWKSPYLMAELDIWDGEAIAGIENGDQRELSAGYRYTADVTPGQINGVRYDGVMRSIVANHVALVATGRAGSDVVVGDSMPKQFRKRSNTMRLARDFKPGDLPPKTGMDDDDLDVGQIFENITTYLQDILSAEQMAEVSSILDGNNPTRSGPNDDLAQDRAVRAQRAAMGLESGVAMDQRHARERSRRYAMDGTQEAKYLEMFPNSNRLVP